MEARNVYGERQEVVKQKMVYPFEALDNFSDFEKPVKNVKKENYSFLTGKTPVRRIKIKASRTSIFVLVKKTTEFQNLTDVLSFAEVFA